MRLPAILNTAMHTLILLSIPLLLSAPALATGFTPEERKQISESIQKVNAAAERAEHEMPPCEGHDFLSAESLPIKPGKSCPRAQKYYDYFVEADFAIRNICHELRRLAEPLALDPSFHRADSETDRHARARHELSKLKEKMNFAITNYEGGVEPDEDPFAKPEGEYAKLECLLPALSGMEFRRKQLMLGNRHFGYVDAYFESPTRANSEEYLRFEREGEKPR